MDMSVKPSLSYPAVQPAGQAVVAAPPVDKPADAKPVERVAAPAESKGSDLHKDNPKDDAKVKAAAEDIQKFFHAVKRNLEFSIDEDSGKVIVKVIASDSGEVVRQIPNAEILKLADSLSDANSLLFRAKA
ncbi:flagellar protein FlaG [Pseudomonas syringae]|uniref:flagellar protein FlaG n=1 Tax=Pseudomonas syringae TaxID=317 RepID=UPI000CD35C27|nr:flagellar protein FlaG [Pseudomonas syringae]MCF5200208.1 flagellar biosynthesis protein FlaG [Pseudomonas syringae]MCF5209890.1 flagellar biosynthesis protein FlaG [Pseudomonas syringae]MCF5215930.1 flagellar biosynthesis protein FlaG [Pseudomonas syringae]MCF5218185.1 flagellar biosynthesis protein FlaG [Pseudomonas syringae]MCF5266587.1 flagellar biosynthesis protein FlaG [Pseudomonas syringae]